MLLQVDDLSVSFGGIVALDRVSFTVDAGQIVGLIGPNGAGKTTLFNCLSRLYQQQHGDIRFEGRSLLSARPHEIAYLGVGRTFQNLALFGTMTVLHNVMVGGHSRTATGFLSNALRLSIVAREEGELRTRAAEMIAFLDLTAFAATPVSALSFGLMKRVEFARALMCASRLLLLDEPASGLNHEEVGTLAQLILSIRDQFGITVLLVEHHMGLVMQISDKIVALNFGRKLTEGSPDQVKNNPDVISAYLGRSR